MTHTTFLIMIQPNLLITRHAWIAFQVIKRLETYG
jgi:hypothetical protein